MTVCSKDEKMVDAELHDEILDVERPEGMPSLPPKVKKLRESDGERIEDNRPPVACSKNEVRDEVDRPAIPMLLVQEATVGKQDEGNFRFFIAVELWKSFCAAFSQKAGSFLGENHFHDDQRCLTKI